ncbi:MAG: hypothetical protein GX430_10835 [Treponema sp.]|nr:hypothetical protein [Treponema sp.]
MWSGMLGRRPLAAAGRAKRRRTSRLVAAALGFTVCLLASQAAASQTTSARAVLVRGTLPVRGIPYLPANSLPALYGEYRPSAGLIRVWVIREELYLPPEWAELPFRSPAGTRTRAYSRPVETGEGPGTAYALRDSSYWILAEVPPPAGDSMPFLEALVGRLAYFAAQAKSPSDLSLPAVLEYRSR